MTGETPEWSRRRVFVVASVIVAVLAVAIWVGRSPTSPSDREAGSSSDQPRSSTSTVVYQVIGTVRWADVTMQTPTGTSQQTPDVPLTDASTGKQGLTFEFPAGSYVAISAQKKDEAGAITCRIIVDGVMVSENTSTAAYGIASCNGRA